MASVLVAALVALIIAILGGPTFIDFLRRNAFGQQIREEGPQHHAAKQGTPTMGGLLIVAAATLAFLPLSDYTLPALTIFGTMLACGAIGFLDDYIKLRHRRSLGLARPLEDADARRDHGRRRPRGAAPAAPALTSSSRSSTSGCRSGGAGTSCSS